MGIYRHVKTGGKNDGENRLNVEQPVGIVHAQLFNNDTATENGWKILSSLQGSLTSLAYRLHSFQATEISTYFRTADVLRRQLSNLAHQLSSFRRVKDNST